MSVASLNGERRHGAVDAAAGASLAHWIAGIRSELHLTSHQALRLWHLDPVACEALLTPLMDMPAAARKPVRMSPTVATDVPHAR